MKDVHKVLDEKMHELQLCRRDIACLRVVLPMLIEDTDLTPDNADGSPPAAQPPLKGWP